MNNQIELNQDWHVSTTFSDGYASVEENVGVAEERQLQTICLVDDACRSSHWVRHLAASCRRADRQTAVEVHSGIEVELLNSNGLLDLPADAEHVDRIFVTARRLPTPHGPMDLDEARVLIEGGQLLPATVVEWLVRGFSSASRRPSSVVISRPFGILSYLGLDESRVQRPFARCLAASLAGSGSALSISERWYSPCDWVVACFLAAGVPVLASTGSRSPSTVGQYEWCRQVVDELSQKSCGDLPLLQAA
jgi:putative hydrolase